jgi:hypothetical protein
MAFADPPGATAWCHDGPRSGFETTALRRSAEGWTATGATTALEDDEAWVVAYRLELDAGWRTRNATVVVRTGDEALRTVRLARAGDDWYVDGAAVPELAGCLDVDLESSALTNAFPMRRLALAVGEAAEAPAAYVRVTGEVQRLEQTYRRLPGSDLVVDYAAPAFDFTATIRYDGAGLVLDYPGIGHRADRPCEDR